MHSFIIFASGKGSNTRAIIDFFKANKLAKVSLIVSNREDAGVLEIAKAEGIETLIVNKTSMHEAEFVEKLKFHKPDFIVLAGFLWKVPDAVIHAFPNRVVNIHPALLPSYGGKGMYGHHVHQAVIGSKERESGITVHYVNEVYDEGNIILQARCRVANSDTPDSLAQKIHGLEHFYYPRVLEYLLKNVDVPV